MNNYSVCVPFFGRLMLETKPEWPWMRPTMERVGETILDMGRMTLYITPRKLLKREAQNVHDTFTGTRLYTPD